MIHPAHQLNLSGDYLKKLSSSDISVQYFNGSKAPTVGTWDKIKIFLNIGGYYKELHNFYPYHNVIKASHETFEQECKNAWQTGLTISAAAVFGIYQLGRRGVVLPVLKKYGDFFKTHRIFRQYIYAWTLPTVLLYTLVQVKHFENVSQLWSVHARRMFNKIVSDPEGTQYPEHLKTSHIVWQDNQFTNIDARAKAKSEVPLQLSQLYQNPEFETVDFGQAAVEQAEQQ